MPIDADPVLTTPIFTWYECGDNPTCASIREVMAGEATSVPEPRHQARSVARLD